METDRYVNISSLDRVNKVDGNMEFLTVPDSATPSEYLSDDSDVIATQCLLPRDSTSPEIDCKQPSNGCVESMESKDMSGSDERLGLRDSPDCPPTLGVQNTYMTLGAGVVEPLTCSEKPTVDMAMVKWPWKAIRRICKLVGGTMLSAMLCLVVAMIITMPRKCEPEQAWWQGQAFYEIFPASFQDTDGNGIGDFNGLVSRLDYIKSLGVAGIRLNSIFTARNYTENYLDVINLTQIDPKLGDLLQFETLMVEAKLGDIKVILDIPLSHTLKNLDGIDKESNMTDWVSDANSLKTVLHAMSMWLGMGVSGFSLVDITPALDKNMVVDLIIAVRELLDSHTVGDNHKILICPADFVETLERLEFPRYQSVMDMCDLINLKLQFNPQTSLESQLKRGWVLSEKETGPWVLWSTGGPDIPRLASRALPSTAPYSNWATILIQSIFPGSMGVFYGDELGLMERNQSQPAHLAPLVTMYWNRSENNGFTSPNVIPWWKSEPYFFTEEVSQNATDLLGSAIRVKREATPIHIKGIFRPVGDYHPITPKNFIIKDTKCPIFALERYYPRRCRYVLLVNEANKTEVCRLSHFYYGGNVEASTAGRTGYIYFRDITFEAGEALIVRLDR